MILTINSTSPSNGVADVAVNTSVSATCSMLMNGSTLTTDTFQLNNGSDEVAGTVTTNAKTATFIPLVNLDYNTTYTAKITMRAQAANHAGTTLDNDYSWSFTTTGDADPPTVRSTIPANGTADVAISSTINATFSEAMQSSTINTNTFAVSDDKGNISGTVSYSDTTATFTPSNNLYDSTTYTARITTGVKDSAGNTLASDYTWSFSTVDTTLPIIISTSPVKEAIGVAINSIITATFSETMQSSTMNTHTFMVSDGSGNISGTVSYYGMIATFLPSSNLSDSTTYTARITTGARDLAGNPIASAYTWSFTTESAPITPTETPIPTPTTTPTPAPTETPTITPSVTPAGCSAEKIAVFPANLEIKKEESDVVTVTLTGEDDCRAEGETIKAKITQGKGRISVLPANAITNAEGLSQFTITALKKTGKAKVKFKSGEADSVVKVEVVK